MLGIVGRAGASVSSSNVFRLRMRIIKTRTGTGEAEAGLEPRLHDLQKVGASSLTLAPIMSYVA